MARRRKGAARPGHGSMCNICGLNCGKGGPLKTHIEGAHKPVTYDAYKICFAEESKIIDAWDDSRSTSKGNKVVIHALVHRFVLPAGSKKATRSPRRDSN